MSSLYSYKMCSYKMSFNNWVFIKEANLGSLLINKSLQLNQYIYITVLEGFEICLISVDHTVRFELPRGKTNNVVSDQVRHKPTCTSTEKS